MEFVIQNKFIVDGYQVILKKPLICEIEYDSIKKQYSFSNDSLSIYLDKTNIEELKECVEQDLLYEAIMYLDTYDLDLSRTQLRVKRVLKKIISSYKKINSHTKNLLIIGCENQDSRSLSILLKKYTNYTVKCIYGSRLGIERMSCEEINKLVDRAKFIHKESDIDLIMVCVNEKDLYDNKSNTVKLIHNFLNYKLCIGLKDKNTKNISSCEFYDIIDLSDLSECNMSAIDTIQTLL